MVRRAFPGSTEVTLFVFLYIFSEKLTKDSSGSVDMYQPISLRCCLLGEQTVRRWALLLAVIEK